MTRVRFLRADGSLAAEAEGRPGQRLLELAQALGLPLEGTCEGAMACSTCHVIVAPADFARLPPASPHEEDMLDFTPHVAPTSRLSCQILLAEELDRLEVRLPPAHANMQGR
ncbi:MAG: 2Fe-2S iron-sulfur cluster-binding protein [Sphingomonadaceae bacterium]|uniref:2Fe-2S iron-sulfur cluster-binding protein n=1 Tax=Thermaurantiacus sp. TaxID=2820283 RepID=UPI00298F0786|nr:2Fe-2S iron-sulfur cluster-binding protein [Thermaurantiacus sp.]MCS6986162.1 2Fe-2S iron-sulfur cluster-binding protein [Sphingomonadaceae bacterium]MDW8414612.1 2Fe-2S iron-sulfur cluster-binding protein [Thermaurantiacus sp.]